MTSHTSQRGREKEREREEERERESDSETFPSLVTLSEGGVQVQQRRGEAQGLRGTLHGYLADKKRRGVTR